jgi:predicted ATP-grasp superfamily ATP-dependent carboligase
MADIDVVQALGLAGIECLAVSGARDATRYSRHTVRWLPPIDHAAHPEQLAALLRLLAQGEPQPPVLHVDTDDALLTVSRVRAALDGAFRLVLPTAELVEDLLDKARFVDLAALLGLPLPPTVVLRAEDPGGPPDLGELRPPYLVKATTKRGLHRLGDAAKALRLDDAEALEARRVQARERGVDLLVQELVPGPETSIESYHAYVDRQGRVLGEFTGAKLRTWPQAFGHSTLLVTTDARGSAADVRAAGRTLVAALQLTGLVKVDYKRDPDGRLWLLEVNPRSTLWHHLGAVAGVNLSGIAHADASDAPLPAAAEARPGIVWCDPMLDLHAVLDRDLTPWRWLREVAGADVRSGMTAGDVAPLLRGRVLRAAGGAAEQAARTARRRLGGGRP